MYCSTFLNWVYNFWIILFVGSVGRACHHLVASLDIFNACLPVQGCANSVLHHVTRYFIIARIGVRQQSESCPPIFIVPIYCTIIISTIFLASWSFFATKRERGHNLRASGKAISILNPSSITKILCWRSKFVCQLASYIP